MVFYVGYPKQLRPFVQRLALQYGSPNFCTESSACFTATAMAFRLLYGQMAGPDLRAHALPARLERQPVLLQHARAARHLHGRARPRHQAHRGRPAAHAARLAGPTSTCSSRPGTDGALALGMAHVILEEGLYDREFVAAHAHGLRGVPRLRARSSTPSASSGITGVPAEKIRAAARLYATTKPAALMPSAAPVVHHTNGVQN